MPYILPQTNESFLSASSKETVYVYVHKKADDGQVFYVGKGKYHRAKQRSGRNIHWKRTVEKHGLVVERVAKFDDYTEDYNDECAKQYEQYLIAYYRTIGVSLVNRTDGGDGTSGLTFSDASRKKMSESAKRRGPPSVNAIEASRKATLGSKQSSLTIRKRVEKRKQTYTEHSVETRRKISEAKKGKPNPQWVEKMRILNTGRKMPREAVERRIAAYKITMAKKREEKCQKQ